MFPNSLMGIVIVTYFLSNLLFLNLYLKTSWVFRSYFLRHFKYWQQESFQAFQELAAGIISSTVFQVLAAGIISIISRVGSRNNFKHSISTIGSRNHFKYSISSIGSRNHFKYSISSIGSRNHFKYSISSIGSGNHFEHFKSWQPESFQAFQELTAGIISSTVFQLLAAGII
jgi:hypothetical protein